MEISGKEVYFQGKEFHDLICIENKDSEICVCDIFISHEHVSDGI